jgi:hypothetical protein
MYSGFFPYGRILASGLLIILCSLLIPARADAETEEYPTISPIGPQTVTEGDTLLFLVTATDPTGLPPKLTASSLPQHAVFVDSGNGTGLFTFTPGYLQAGVDTVYFIADVYATLDSELVEITINEAGPQPPEIEFIGRQTVIIGNLRQFLVGATDPDDSVITMTISDVPNTSITEFGKGSETFRFTPDASQEGVLNITFYASDGVRVDSEVVPFNVVQSNQLPVFDRIGPQTAQVGSPLIFNLSATDPNGYPPFLKTSQVPDGSIFTLTGDSSTAQFSWDPPDSLAGTVDTMEFQATDGLTTAPTSIFVPIVTANLPPVLNSIGAHTVVNGAENLTIPVTAVDPDGGELGYFANTLPTGVSIVDLENGTGNVTVDAAAVALGAQDITVFATDGRDEDSTVFTLSVQSTNAAPVLDPIGGKNAIEGINLSFTLTASDGDGTTPFFTSTALPQNASLTDNGDGTALFSFTPSYQQDGTSPITFIASDGLAADSELVSIIVADAGNQPPVFDPLEPQTISEGDTLELTIIVVDPDGTSTSISPTPLPDNAEFPGEAADTALFRFRPDFTQAGDYMIRFLAEDATDQNIADSVDLNITVLDRNAPPQIEGVPDQTTSEGRLVSFDITATDVDGDIPVLTSGVLPQGAQFSSAGEGVARFEYSPDFGLVDSIRQIASFSVPFYASDGIDSDTISVKITISDARPDINDPGEPDTLFLSSLSPGWNGLGAVALECTVNNDSDITAFSTGFTWDDPNLLCDSIIVGPELADANYKQTQIFEGLQTFYVSAYYYVPTAFSSGAANHRELYFTAWFHLQDTQVWGAASQVKFDSTKVGTTGEFLFDHGQHTPTLNPVGKGEFPLALSALTSYRALIKLDFIRAPVAADDEQPPVPYTFRLDQNVPNPFNPSTMISFSLDRAADVSLAVYNILGQRVRVLLDDYRPAGQYEIIWDGKSESKRPVASGIYFYRLVMGDRALARKMVLIR